MQSKLLSKQHWLTALLCLLLLVSGLLTGIENVSAQDKPQTGVEAEPIGKLRTSIVTMTRIDPATGLPTPNPNGHAGVVVDPQGYVLTTGGCSKVGDRYRVRMSDLNEFDGKVVAIHEAVHLMVLKINSPQPLPAVSLDKIHEPKKGDLVYLVNSPATQELVAGRILDESHSSKEGQPEIVVDLKLPSGEGGSLIVSEHGQPIGIPYGIRHAGTTESTLVTPLKLAPQLIKSAMVVVKNDAPVAATPLPVTEAKMPDISGTWQHEGTGAFPISPNRFLIRRSATAEDQFELETLLLKDGKLVATNNRFVRLKWSPKLKRFETLSDGIEEPEWRPLFELQTNGKLKLIHSISDEEAELLRKKGVKEVGLDSVRFQTWVKSQELVAKASLINDVADVVGSWARDSQGPFSKLTIRPVMNREGCIFIECAEGTGLCDLRLGKSGDGVNGFFTLDLLDSRTVRINVSLKPDNSMQFVVAPFDDQRKQLLQSGFAKTQRELDQKLMSELKRVAAVPPLTTDTVTLVKTQFEPARIRDSLRSKFGNEPYRFFSNDTFKSVIVIAPAKDQDDIEAAIHKLDVNGDLNTQVPATGLLKADRPAATQVRTHSPEAQRLLVQLQTQEAIAVAEANAIRTLQSGGKAQENKKAIAAHQLKLKSVLSTALDLKLQLEELQLKELQSKLSQLERQIGQRKTQREKIIERRATELIDGDALKWNSNSSPAADRVQTEVAPLPLPRTSQSESLPVFPGVGVIGTQPPRTDSGYEPPTQKTAAALPTVESLRVELEPLQQRVHEAAKRLQTAESQYFKAPKDAAKAGALQVAWDELVKARGNLCERLEPARNAMRSLDVEMRQAQDTYEAFAKQHAAKLEQLAKGEATEAQVKASLDSSKRTQADVDVIRSWMIAYQQFIEEFGGEGLETAASRFHSNSSVTAPDVPASMALIWLEATTGLSLEFVTFDNVKLPIKAALRVREASGIHKARDLLVALNGKPITSLNQAVHSLASKTVIGTGTTYPNTFLSGGLGGSSSEFSIMRNGQYKFLQPNAGPTSVRFEARVRNAQTKEIETTYIDGVCVSLDGLVVLPISAKTLAEGEPLKVYEPFQLPAQIVARDDAHRLTLVKLNGSRSSLFNWMKCSAALPTKGQRLKMIAPENNSIAHVTVFGTGHSYWPPMEGNDAFDLGPVAARLGAPLMTLDDELQGIVLAISSEEPNRDNPKPRHLCVPAIHIEKLIEQYRRDAT